MSLRAIPIKIQFHAILIVLALFAGQSCGGGGPPARTPEPTTNPDATPGSIPAGLPVIVDPDEVFVVNSSGGEPTLIHSSGGIVSELAWSPDGQQIAFSVGLSINRGEIYVSDVNGKATKVTDIDYGADRGTTLLWSPNGSRFAATGWGRFTDGTAPARVVVVESDGTSARMVYSEDLTLDALPFSVVGWTADGSSPLMLRGNDIIKISIPDGPTTIASALGKPLDLAVISPDGTQLALVLQSDEVCQSAPFSVVLDLGTMTFIRQEPPACGITTVAWSPDGAELAYATVNADLQNVVAAFNPTSGTSRQVSTFSGRSIYKMEWLADGSGLTGQHCYEGCTSAGYIPALGGEERRLVELDFPYGAFAGFSPDSRRYLYSDDAVRTAALDGQTTVLTSPDSTYGYETLEWSPAGDRVAYVRGPGDTPIRYSVDVETGHVRRTSYPFPPGAIPSPNGEKALIRRNRSPTEPELVLKISDGDGSNERILVDADAHSYIWSPDSESVAYVVQNSNVVTIVDVGTGESQELANARIKGSLSYSPDGSLLAGVGLEGSLVVLELESEERRVVADDLAATSSQTLSWSPDGEKLLYASRGTAGLSSISIVGVDEMGPQRLTDSPLQDINPTWSPDGETVAFLRIGANNPPPLYRESSLMIVSVRSREEEQLVQASELTEFTNNRPIWSPDGRTLAIYSPAAGIAGIYVVNVEHPVLQPLATGRWAARGYSDIAWSDDGSRVVFSSFYAGL